MRAFVTDEEATATETSTCGAMEVNIAQQMENLTLVSFYS